jgi:hypothetical protein
MPKLMTRLAERRLRKIMSHQRKYSQQAKLLTRFRKVPAHLSPRLLLNLADLLATRIRHKYELIAVVQKPPKNNRSIRRPPILPHRRKLHIPRVDQSAIAMKSTG